MGKKKLVEYITQEEFEKIYHHSLKLERYSTKKRKKWLKQYRIAMLLGFESGMRISEIIGLKEEVSECCQAKLRKEKEVDERKQRIYCSKCDDKLSRKNIKRGEEWKIKPLSKDQINGHQIKIVEGKGGKDRKVPKPKRLNKTAINMLPLKISRRSLQKFIKDSGKDVLKKDISFHTLRHGFGSHLAGKNVSLEKIQLLMGHSRLDTTGMYLHANPAQVIDEARNSF